MNIIKLWTSALVCSGCISLWNAYVGICATAICVSLYRAKKNIIQNKIQQKYNVWKNTTLFIIIIIFKFETLIQKQI